VVVLVATSAAAQGSNSDDLSNAFGNPTPIKVFEPEHNVPPPPVLEGADAKLRAGFERDFAAAKQRFEDGAAAEARDQLTMVELSAVALGGPERVRVVRLQRAVAQKLGDQAAIKEADGKWLGSCGPADVAACRSAALDAIAAYDAAFAKKVRAADECLAGAEQKAGQAPPGCLESALALYRKADDVLMVSRVELLRALVLAADRKQAKAARKALAKLGGLQDDRTALVRRTALETLSRIDLSEGQVDAAVNDALQASAAWALALPPERRPWARSPALDVACREYEKGKRAGACRQLEKNVLGDYVFHDYSDQHVEEGHLLSHDLLVAVNEHYNVLVQNCLAAEIRTLEHGEAFTYRVRWLVINDGRVDNFHSESTQQDQSRFVTCLRNQFGYWRYPSHEGDPQRIEQGFSVKSSTRTTEETER